MPVLILIALVGVAILATQAYGQTSDSSAEGSPDDVQTVAGTAPNIIPTLDIMNYAYQAGFDDSNVLTAVAIALAESGGDTNAYNPELAAGTPTGLGSVGLWQIYQKAHPEFASLDLRDPGSNAAAAFQVYSRAGNSFKPWTTFSGYWRDRLGNDANGNPKYGPVTKHTPERYLAYLPAAQVAFDTIAANSQVQAADNSNVVDTTDTTGDTSGE